MDAIIKKLIKVYIFYFQYYDTFILFHSFLTFFQQIILEVLRHNTLIQYIGSIVIVAISHDQCTAFLNEFATVVESFVQYTVKIIMKINVFCCWIQVEPCTLKNFHIS